MHKGSNVSGFDSTYADLNSGYQFKFEYDIQDYINNNNQIQFEAPSDKSYYYLIVFVLKIFMDRG